MEVLWSEGSSRSDATTSSRPDVENLRAKKSEDSHSQSFAAADLNGARDRTAEHGRKRHEVENPRRWRVIHAAAADDADEDREEQRPEGSEQGDDERPPERAKRRGWCE